MKRKASPHENVIALIYSQGVFAARRTHAPDGYEDDAVATELQVGGHQALAEQWAILRVDARMHYINKFSLIADERIRNLVMHAPLERFVEVMNMPHSRPDQYLGQMAARLVALRPDITLSIYSHPQFQGTSVLETLYLQVQEQGEMEGEIGKMLQAGHPSHTVACSILSADLRLDEPVLCQAVLRLENPDLEKALLGVLRETLRTAHHHDTDMTPFLGIVMLLEARHAPRSQTLPSVPSMLAP